MRAAVIPSYGDEDVLTIGEVPSPSPGPDEVLVDVIASAMNRADLLQRRGLYPAPGPKPTHEIPGIEFAGRIAHLGERVTGWSVGDAVMGIVGGGAMAQQVVTHERMLQRVPDSVDVRDAAAIPEVFVTAHDALVTQGGLASGGTALVHAGASGVGTAATQIARAIGATVAVTCSAAKAARCVELGANLAVDYNATDNDWADAVLDWTDGDGVNVIVDVVGGDYLARNVRCVATQGRIIQVGVMAGAEATFPLGALMPKRAALIGTVLRSRPLEQKIAANQAFVAQLLGRFDDGSLRPVIDSRFDLERLADAHRYMATNANVGKILIDVA